ncbi:pyridoxal phosphate-dependent decarboxylase family protein [Psychroflexus halocasei]|uniref:Glutamate decarboxylase/sulfinoalanine decarboxylase/sulfinoalanine decarboxylase / aspartate 1-decarboxylase n=1 Tax=Psychroflexus halocasei TaxID=908615 RepID=A0A1H3WV70_9FLAO|nr:aminotransferase class V-fold PLP-dependent enzyme [Psychroflexus halocasei]SDZ90870.1 glutamate decarboxylase/sulfinoalanine decarboxylase/sulfinoalanine decarboxylase / aspartate 1-decarboxylase [Psychroflexus halocasei]
MQMQEDLSLFQKIATKLLQKEKENGVVKPIPPKELLNQLDLELQDEALSEENFEKALTDVVYNTPRTSTSLFFNQLFGGRQSKGTLGELIAAMLNNSMYTYKVGGPQVGIEKNIIKKVCELIGYSENADGTFPPGGSMSNFMALIMARDAHNRKIKNEGVSSKMIVYTSEDSHYSIQKNTTFAGIGINQIRNIKTNANGQMDVDALAQQIAEDEEAGYKPCFVNATAGTTVLGVFDDIKAIHNVIKSKDIWLHVDGAYCGAAIFSDQYKHLLKGLELTDSFSFNAHKMLGVPLSCSIIVTQDKANLKHSFACDANYLYQTDGDDYNLGKTSIQCGRRNDALKFWTLWKSIGTKGLEQLVDKQFHLANVALDYVKNNSDYTVYSDEDSVSVCFNYKGINPKLLCNSLYEDAELMVGYGSFNEHTFVRLVTVNTCNEEEDILNFFKVLEAYVEKKQLAEVNV